MPDERKKRSLNVAEDHVQNVRPIPPLADSFPSSEKIKQGELEVPARRIDLSNDDPAISGGRHRSAEQCRCAVHQRARRRDREPTPGRRRIRWTDQFRRASTRHCPGLRDSTR